MKAVEIEQIAEFVCGKIKKTTRFSNLSQMQLVGLWKTTCKYLHEHVLLKKSVNFIGIGSFSVKHTKKLGLKGEYTETVWSIYFNAAPSWEKLPGFSIDKEVKSGCNAAETINLAVISAQMNLNRDVIESGLKDIILGLTRHVRLTAPDPVSLSLGPVGHLTFKKTHVRFQFSPILVKKLNGAEIPVHKPAEILKSEPPQPAILASAPKLQAPKAEVIVAEKKNEPTADIETQKMVKHLEEATEKLNKLEELISQTFKESDEGSHTHYYVGNRNWKNDTCTICKTDTITNDIDKEALKKTEKENDKMLLHISLAIDQAYLDKEKNDQEKKQAELAEAAKFNLKKGVEKQELLKAKEKHCMGDVFNGKRKIIVPVMSADDSAEGINDQIKAKQMKRLAETKLHEQQDFLMCEKLKKEIQIAKMEKKVQKSKKTEDLRNSLAAQIQINQNIRKEESLEKDPVTNPFARSESLMSLYRKQKEKELYEEQLQIVHKKNAFAKRVSQAEKRNALEKNENARKEMLKDFATVVKEKADRRGNLESYWADQRRWKSQIQKTT